MRFFAVSILFIFLLPACTPDEISGEFAWATTDDRGILEPERSLLEEREFRFGRQSLYFYDYETIWWMYQIRTGNYKTDDFLVVLYENNGSPDPVELDLRQVRVEKQSGKGLIRQKYESLDPGNYILKIAYKSRPVDTVEFQVVSQSGPSGISDYEEEPPEGADEIIYYSSSPRNNSF